MANHKVGQSQRLKRAGGRRCSSPARSAASRSLRHGSRARSSSCPSGTSPLRPNLGSWARSSATPPHIIIPTPATLFLQSRALPCNIHHHHSSRHTYQYLGRRLTSPPPGGAQRGQAEPDRGDLFPARVPSHAECEQVKPRTKPYTKPPRARGTSTTCGVGERLRGHASRFVGTVGAVGAGRLRGCKTTM